MSSSLDDELPHGAFEHTVAVALAGHRAFLARLDELGDDPLAALLDHVRRTVPYYQGYGTALADYPVIDRDTARAERERLLSAHVVGEERLFGSTNGTLSVPLRVRFDEASYYELYQFLHARFAASRRGLREQLVPGDVGIHYVTDIHEDPRLTAYVAALGGVLLRRMPLGRGGDEDIATVHALRAARTIVYGKPFTLLRLAELDRAVGGGKIAPLWLATSGANLYPDFRRRLERWFGCGIIDAYVATESGPVAIDCEHGVMHVLEDRIHVEILRPDGTLAREGTGELVVTNFMNWAQPFVRYRLGDACTIETRACPCGADGPTIVALPGREVAAYEVAGVGSVSADQLGRILLRDDIVQFEVAEPEPGRLLVRWIPDHGADLDALAGTLARELTAVVGTSYELRQVERITVDGGKALRFVRQPRFPE